VNKDRTRFKPSGVEWLGEVPEHWKVCKIKRLSPVKRGASPRPIDDLKYFDDDGEFSWVRISDVTASGKYLTQTTEKLSTLGSSLSVKLDPDTFFVSIAASVGKPAITKIKCCIHDGFVYLPYLKINPDFLYYLFEGGQLFQGLGKLGTQLNLNTETIGSIHIPIPPDDEIKSITEYLDLETAKIDSLIAEKERMISLLKERRPALITAAVTGKIELKEMKI
jgi:type I restriction enzyme, S subunit